MTFHLANRLDYFYLQLSLTWKKFQLKNFIFKNPLINFGSQTNQNTPDIVNIVNQNEKFQNRRKNSKISKKMIHFDVYCEMEWFFFFWFFFWNKISFRLLAAGFQVLLLLHENQLKSVKMRKRWFHFHSIPFISHQNHDHVRV